MLKWCMGSCRAPQWGRVVPATLAGGVGAGWRSPDTGRTRRPSAAGRRWIGAWGFAAQDESRQRLGTHVRLNVLLCRPPHDPASAVHAIASSRTVAGCATPRSAPRVWRKLRDGDIFGFLLLMFP